MPQKTLLALLAALFLLTAPLAAGAQNDDPLKFESSPEGDATAGVKVVIDLERDGQKSTVGPEHVFRTGDRVKIHYTTNIDCYVYWMSEGASGDYFMLFPNPKVGMDNWVEKNTPQTIPAKEGAAFRFAEPAGVEKIVLIMSPEKMPELEEAAREAAVKGGRVETSSDQVASVKEKQEEARKTRDLVFETSQDQATGVTTHTQVSRDIAQPFVVNIDLVHK